MSKIIPMASFEPLRGKLSITINYKTTHKGAEIETAMFEYSSEGIVGERTA